MTLWPGLAAQEVPTEVDPTWVSEFDTDRDNELRTDVDTSTELEAGPNSRVAPTFVVTSTPTVEVTLYPVVV